MLNKIGNAALVLSNGHSVPLTSSARNLGFIFDSHLTFSDQVFLVSTTFVIFVVSVTVLVLSWYGIRTIGASFVSLQTWLLQFYLLLPISQLNRIQHTKSALARAVVAAPRSSNVDYILIYTALAQNFERQRNALNTKLLLPHNIAPPFFFSTLPRGVSRIHILREAVAQVQFFLSSPSAPFSCPISLPSPFLSTPLSLSCPSRKSSTGVWESAVSSLSGVWGRAPAEIEFGAFYL